MSLKSLIIRVFPRLHLTLIGMNSNGYRVNGGVGFAIKNPSLRIKFSRSKDFIFIDNRQHHFLKNEILRIEKIINQEKARISGRFNIRVEFKNGMPTHYGFGSSSAIRLACLEALYLLNNKTPKKERLILSSGRGGTSGIGINVYFDGGLIVDLGKKTIGSTHFPSHLSEKRKNLPLVMQGLKMPKWGIGICIPNNIPPKSENEEVEFFKKTCPISTNHVYKILYNVIYGLYSAVREKDKETFCKSLISIQTCAWKLAERKQYGMKLFRIEKQLYLCGADAVGMSSLGPTLFFLAKDVDIIIQRMKTKGVDCKFSSTMPLNSGREIIHV